MNVLKLGSGRLFALALICGLVGFTAPARAQEPEAAAPASLESFIHSEANRKLTEGLAAQPADSSVAPAQAGAVKTKAKTGKAAAPAGGLRSAVAADSTFKCLPSCSATDGRFLAIAGTNLITLSRNRLDLEIQVPAGSTEFLLGFFDGDGGEFSPDGTAYWDTGLTAPFVYRLYADPAGDGTGMVPVDMLPGQEEIDSATMPDNAWIDYTIPTSAAAQSPAGNFFYVLRVELANPLLTTLNAFKVRSTAVLSGVTLNPSEQPFSYIANWTALEDISVVYPNFPDASPTTYDGTFNFYFDVPVTQSSVSFWDGDFDRGNYDFTNQDTDDPDTPGIPFLPPWATGDSLFEGVAFGGLEGTGNPADNQSGADFGIYILREPTVRYDLLLPDGQIFANENPSGNQEWEQFKITTVPGDPADYTATSLPAGTYHLRIQGVDMLNLNALLLPYRVLCEEESGVPCTPLRPFRVGDTVFLDRNGDGTQGAGEAGIAGVAVQLVDGMGFVIATATTDASGHYSFPTEKGEYTVRIAAANFNAGGALQALVSTTGGDEQTREVVDNNVLTYDFGYRGTASLGDRIWTDADADGIQDADETGINDVTVELRDSGGNVVATTTTSGDGDYSFANLQTGTYTVRVIASTLPAGSTATYDVDGVATANTATVTLNGGQKRTDVDFGFRPANARLGDRIWNDADGDGIQDAGEAGLNGVTVQLIDSSLNVVATQVTSGDGNYAFTNLQAGVYTVQVVAATLPAGSTQTYDLDGLGSANRASVTLSAGQNRNDIDFGYRQAKASLGDRLWNDADADGVQDAGEAGLNGVTVQLLNGSGTVVATQVTAGNGNYNFANLDAGTYTVQVVAATLPAGSVQTYDLDGTGTANRATATVTAGQTRTDLDFGFRQVGSIGDRLWYDSDGDGVQDAGEPGLENTRVELVNGSGTVVATTTTGLNGIYNFTNVTAGTYTVRVVTSTFPVGGLTPTYDLDGIGTANTAVVTLAGGQNRTEVDFGYRGTRSVGDRVWNDVDGDGIQDTGEAGINGVTVRLFLGTSEVASTVTSGNGNYSFSTLPETTFTVRIDTATLPAGMTQTYDLDGVGTPHQTTFNLTASRTDIDFGYRTPPVSCTAGGYVRDDFNSASFSNNNGTLSWSGAWIESDSAGAGVSSGNVTVGSPYSGYLFLRDYPDTGTQPSAARQANLAGFASATLSFYFHVRTAVDPTDAVTVEVSKDGGATYTVLEVLDGFTGTAEAGRSYNISAYIASNFRVRFRVTNGYGASDELFKVDWIKVEGSCAPSQVGSIGNRVWNDADGDGVQDTGEAGLNGVTVQLLNSSGTVIATTTTAGDGAYSFGNLAAASYSVRIVTSTLPAGMVPTYDLDGTGTANTAAVSLTAGQNRTDADFGYRTPVSCTAGGYFRDDFNSASFSNNNGTLSWSGAWIESDSAGAGVSSGNVTVGSPYAGYLFLRDYPDTGTQPSAARQANLSGFASATLSFGFHVRTGVDPTDAVTVEVSKDGGATYTVLEVLDGFSGTDEATRSYNISAYIASNFRVRFRVTNGYGASDELFKLDWIKVEGSCGSSTATASIGDRVWKDADCDGLQDSGEVGLSGITVQLLDGAGAVIRTATTSTSGNYSFTGLAAGTYTVRVVSSTLPYGYTQTYDRDGTSTAHKATVTVTTGQVRTDVDFGYKP